MIYDIFFYQALVEYKIYKAPPRCPLATPSHSLLLKCNTGQLGHLCPRSLPDSIIIINTLPLELYFSKKKMAAAAPAVAR